ncbi:aminoacyl-tRNA hydrolase [Paenibacillus turpanensis]|uniref:aminoacyl-tRNA hydrolase n=1 Tax=Paenibacillus turpanensis TaxID=2689078 RepID=UPI00140C0A21|nr:aminoacyl-tRNA hydrolase [Paenibacillus turpanensis]
MKWIIGLGNPGNEYRSTRHNVGFMAIDRLAEKWGIDVSQSKCKALLGEGRVQGQKVVLIKPITYMNLSGESARAFQDFYKADLSDMLILYDDLDTAMGQIRLRYQGSAGGHNGIKSLIQHLGTQSFNRVRMGISRPPAGVDIAHYVLSSFRKEEAEALENMIQATCDAVSACLTDPFEKVMAKFNGNGMKG